MVGLWNMAYTTDYPSPCLDVFEQYPTLLPHLHKKHRGYTNTNATHTLHFPQMHDSHIHFNQMLDRYQGFNQSTVLSSGSFHFLMDSSHARPLFTPSMSNVRPMFLYIFLSMLLRLLCLAKLQKQNQVLAALVHLRQDLQWQRNLG